VVAGQTATYQLSLSPQQFSGSVTMSCAESTTIPDTNCAVSPNPVTFSGTSPALVTVTVTTIARPALAFPEMHGRPRIYGGFYLLRWVSCLISLGVAVLCLRRRRAFNRAVLSLAFLLLGILAGCQAGAGGSAGTATTTTDPGTPAGTYQLLVSATSAGVTQTMILTLTVQ
jgi:hypothetical protein